MPENVRLFLLSNLQHAATANARSEPLRDLHHPSNPLYAGPPLRALLVAMDAWIDAATAAAGEPLPEHARTARSCPRPRGGRLPADSRFHLQRHVNEPAAVDDDRHAAEVGGLSGLRAEDRCGRAHLAGIRLPTIEAPLATHLGWNYRKAGFAEGALCDNFGAMFPFAKTREERQEPTIRACRWPSAIRTTAIAPPHRRPRNTSCRIGCCWRTT